MILHVTSPRCKEEPPKLPTTTTRIDTAVPEKFRFVPERVYLTPKTHLPDLCRRKDRTHERDSANDSQPAQWDCTSPRLTAKHQRRRRPHDKARCHLLLSHRTRHGDGPTRRQRSPRGRG